MLRAKLKEAEAENSAKGEEINKLKGKVQQLRQVA